MNLAVEYLIEALDGRLALLVSHEHVDLVEIVARAEQLLDQYLAEKPGGARDEYRLVLVVVDDGAPVLPGCIGRVAGGGHCYLYII